MYQYIAYGLTIRSSFPLAQLETVDGNRSADLVIRSDPTAASQSEVSGPDRRVTVRPGTVVLEYPGVGTFRIKGGREILVDADPGVDPTLRNFHLLGPTLAVALHQRGRLVLHASAVTIDGSGVLFVGETNAGKSTLAARCVDAGHTLLTDDLAVVDRDSGESHLRSGFPSVKLDAETIAALDYPADETIAHGESSEEGSSVDKACYPVGACFEGGPVPIERIFVLTDGDSISLESMASPQAVAALYRHAFLRELSDRTGESENLFDRCAELAEQHPVKRLSRPRDLDRLPTVVERIEADVGK